jgi:hypothetical protein
MHDLDNGRTEATRLHIQYAPLIEYFRQYFRLNEEEQFGLVLFEIQLKNEAEIPIEIENFSVERMTGISY